MTALSFAYGKTTENKLELVGLTSPGGVGATDGT